jgi:ribonuclease D
MSHVHIRSAEEADVLSEALSGATRFALDCEAAGFHRYSDRLCLLQITVADETYVVDPLAFDPTPLLRGPLEDPSVAVVMHGADFDLRLLSRDLGLRLHGLVDTQIQAALIGETALGLSSLLESRLGVRLSKKFQRADWAARPLEEGMLEYAADDTRYLERLTDLLAVDVEAKGRTSWAEEECRALEEVSDQDHAEETDEDPVLRVKGARDLPARHVHAIREALAWRDEVAREKDRAPFRVVGDKPLIEAVGMRPRRVEELVEVQGFPTRLARAEGKELLRRLRAVAELPEAELVPYPRGVRRGPGRPPPELEALFDRLKGVRNRAADQVGLPKGTLLSNAMLLEIARAAPATVEEMLSIEGMRRWKVEVVGERLLEAVRAG